MTHAQQKTDEELMRDTALLVREVKDFGQRVGIEPTNALSQSSYEKPVKSMLWLWMQRKGTIALRKPIDIRIGLRFSAPQEQFPLERLYNASGYSVYFRQGNQFGDAEAVTTLEFARESTFTKVTTVLHEDLHGDKNFDLMWEIEESIITPLSLLAALEFFRERGDEANVTEARSTIEERSKLARELQTVAEEAECLFEAQTDAEARNRLLELVSSSSVYSRWYKHHMKEQDDSTAFEAKISHDLAYYKFFARIVSLERKLGDLKALIREFKKIPRDSDMERAERYLARLEELSEGSIHVVP
ncbi:MAG: hypothetical protein HY695_17015 [Deltaproteobacteria bacterium]|nr:hypothetical protein [Deltaproteobacteria bacterium]